MLGHPKYQHGDRVVFRWKDGTLTGVIRIVDAYGTFGQDREPSYDIYREEDNTLYKHLPESFIVEQLSADDDNR